MSATNLVIDEPEVLITANIETSGRESYAPYVATGTLREPRLHRRECEWAHRVSHRNRVYYCSLEKASRTATTGARSVCRSTATAVLLPLFLFIVCLTFRRILGSIKQRGNRREPFLA